ncbi:MAG TPA: glycosyltransferase [Solirubrobacteraceae bacterium]|nr:glycosyltransferase [Solirubrobacteraceae bacterium]
MRILVTVPWGEPLGGAESMLQGVLDGAREEGHELELVFMQGGSWPVQLRQAGFQVDVIATGRLRDVTRSAVSVVRLARLMRRRNPDLILNWAAKTQLYGAPAALLAGMARRVVWWQHSIPGGNWLDRVATLLPAVAIGCTSQAAAVAQARLFPARHTFVVAAGAPVPAAGSPTVSLDLPVGVPIVGLVGRLQPWKGQDRLLRAHALLRERGHRLHTLIVGGDAYGLSTDYAASLPGLIEELGLASEVTLTGQVADAGPYIERLDVLVNASDPEPFGIVLLEGMARGVAVLAVNSGGPAGIVEDGVTGVLAASGEPAALADSLEGLLASEQRRQELGRAGHESFMRDFTEAAMRRRFFAALEAVIERGAAR